MSTPAPTAAAGASSGAAANTTSPNPNSGPHPDFKTNERVLCYHGPLIYEAKVLKSQMMEEPSQITGLPGMHYFVHYKGWKQTWDEWVAAFRLLKHDEAGLALQKELQEKTKREAAASTSSHAAGGTSNPAHTASTTSKAPKAGSAGHTSASVAAGGSRAGGARKDTVASHGASRGTKRARDEDDYSSKKMEMKLNIPEHLKQRLVDDWENVTKNSMIVKVPKTPTAKDVLNEFGEWVLQTKPPNLKDPEDLVPTVISGLTCYFDKSLGTHLLYRFERKQYAEIRKRFYTGPHVRVGVDEKEMSEIYGAEHLLRLLVSLPQMVAQTTLDPESVNIIKEYVNELLQYMLRERERIFSEEYPIVGPAYQNVARS